MAMITGEDPSTTSLKYREKLEILEKNKKIIYCPATNRPCEYCEYRGEDDNILVFLCCYTGQKIFTESDGYTTVRSHSCIRLRERVCCKVCDHFGDCMISTIQKGEDPYADLCELAESEYLNYLKSMGVTLG